MFGAEQDQRDCSTTSEGQLARCEESLGQGGQGKDVGFTSMDDEKILRVGPGRWTYMFEG